MSARATTDGLDVRVAQKTVELLSVDVFYDTLTNDPDRLDAKLAELIAAVRVLALTARAYQRPLQAAS